MEKTRCYVKRNIQFGCEAHSRCLDSVRGHAILNDNTDDFMNGYYTIFGLNKTAAVKCS